jgi:hypothetical protein
MLSRVEREDAQNCLTFALSQEPLPVEKEEVRRRAKTKFLLIWAPRVLAALREQHDLLGRTYRVLLEVASDRPAAQPILRELEAILLDEPEPPEPPEKPDLEIRAG